MTLLARHLGTQMSPVIEARVCGEIMDLDPGNGLGRGFGIRLQVAAKPEGLVEFFQFGRYDGLRRSIRFASLQEFRNHDFLGGGDKAMAGHANAGGRDAGVATPLGAIMTVETGYLHITRMLPVGESDGLLRFVPLLVAW
jgi:hypothetical protein